MCQAEIPTPVDRFLFLQVVYLNDEDIVYKTPVTLIVNR